MINVALISNNTLLIDNYITIKKIYKQICYIYQLTDENIEEKMLLTDIFILCLKEDSEIDSLYEWIKKIRQVNNKDIYVFMESLTKKQQITCLRLGVDAIFDFSVNIEELSLVLLHILKRRFKQITETSIEFSSNAIQIFSEDLSILIDGKKKISLTKLEYRLISYLIKYSGVIVSHEELSLLLWKKNDSKSYCKLATLVFQLRQKIEIDPKNPRFVQTIRGKGYKLIL
ncbi:winged helix-turn-helix domain-containing protein [Enterococcus termitis]|uniref:OmpR/PhoB-type domain-containing protein n=1 Tax=Enterococcus termitis TaxID=332950 RepID=A0A1E5GAV7_9ENTE|nr:winged helix-turn-helix domain-containing protein [Enterococcus termitis]OEG09823.1 hypothetical protein BCR25_09975 [Enterococcus termitis]OJG98327.1 hypothetical protein RV18_GL003228 [Enterococcus termitis]